MNRWTRYVNFLATNSTDRRRCAACREIVNSDEDSLRIHAAAHGCRIGRVDSGVTV